MDFLFELIFDLLFESALSATKCEKVPRSLRFTIGLLLTLIVLGLLGGVLALAVYLFVARRTVFNVALGVLLSVLDAVMVYSATKKARRQIRKRRNAGEESASEEEKGEENAHL